MSIYIVHIYIFTYLAPHVFLYSLDYAYLCILYFLITLLCIPFDLDYCAINRTCFYLVCSIYMILHMFREHLLSSMLFLIYISIYCLIACLFSNTMNHTRIWRKCSKLYSSYLPYLLGVMQSHSYIFHLLIAHRE